MLLLRGEKITVSVHVSCDILKTKVPSSTSHDRFLPARPFNQFFNSKERSVLHLIFSFSGALEDTPSVNQGNGCKLNASMYPVKPAS